VIPRHILALQFPDAKHGIRKDFDVEMKTRDGVTLRADVVRPDIDAKVPAVLLRTIYNKAVRQSAMGTSAVHFATQGFAFVVQDTRGRYRSEGEWDWRVWGQKDRRDGYDAIEWVASLPWCNGNVGTVGSSYEGGTQLECARSQAPHLKAIAPSMAAMGYDGVMRSTMMLETIIIAWVALVAADTVMKKYPPGPERDQYLALTAAAFADPVAVANALPLKDMPVMRIPGMIPYSEVVTLLSSAALTYKDNYESMLVPALVTSGWYDIAVGDQVYRGLRDHGGSKEAKTGTKLILGPWGHSDIDSHIGELGFGPAGYVGSQVPPAYIRFFGRHLRGDNVPELPNVRYFLMGADTWKNADDWPLPGTQTERWYLHSAGRANSAAGNGRLSTKTPASGERPDGYRYDPLTPVPSWGHRVAYFGGSTIHGPFDQRRIEQRPDVLVYTSDALDEPLEVVGNLELRLFLSTNVLDTDIIAKVCDVDPSGISLNVADGIVRARFRNGWEKPEMLKPGEVYEFRVDMGPAAWLFRSGHRLRVQVTSSAFPHWERNMNTGHAAGEDAEGVVANHTVLHSAEHPSHLLLPVQPRKS